MFLEEIAISAGVSWKAFIVIAEDIAGEEKLRIATGPRAERHEEHFCLGGEEPSELMRNAFEFGCIGAGVLERFHLIVEEAGFSFRFTDRTVTGPSDMSWNQTEVADHGEAFARHSLNEAWTGGAIKRTGTQFDGAKPNPDGLLGGSHAVGSGCR